MKKRYYLIAVIAVIVFAGISYVMFNLQSAAVKFVTISINPEISLALNSQDKVVDVLPMNDDADVILSDLELEGLYIENATDEIIDAALETGYIDEYSDENTILVTSVSEDEKTRQALEKKVMTKLNERLETRKIYPIVIAVGLDEDLKAEAESYDISNGKMLLIEKATTLNPDLSKKDLADKSIREIQAEIKAYIKDRHEALKVSLEEAKETWKAEKEVLKSEYKEKVENIKENIIKEKREEFKNLTKEEKQEKVKKYLNDLKDTVTDNVTGIKDQIKDNFQEVVNDDNYTIIKDKATSIKDSIREAIERYRSNKE